MVSAPALTLTLFGRLWTNDYTFVDFEHGLNAVVVTAGLRVGLRIILEIFCEQPLNRTCQITPKNVLYGEE